MPTIYISDRGDDKNDGLSLQTPIYSLKRAKELHGGRLAFRAASLGAHQKRSFPRRITPNVGFRGLRSATKRATGFMPTRGRASD